MGTGEGGGPSQADGNRGQAASTALRSQPPRPERGAGRGATRASFVPRASAEAVGAGQVVLGWGLLRVRVCLWGRWGWGACGGGSGWVGGEGRGSSGSAVSWEWNLLEEWSLGGEDLVGVVGVFWG